MLHLLHRYMGICQVANTDKFLSDSTCNIMHNIHTCVEGSIGSQLGRNVMLMLEI